MQMPEHAASPDSGSQPSRGSSTQQRSFEQASPPTPPQVSTARKRPGGFAWQKQVGLSATGLYHYVGGKEDILAQLMTDTIAEIGRETDVLAAGSTDPEVLLRAFVRAHLRVAVTTPAGRVLSNHQDIVVSETYSDVIRDARRRHERRLESILADGAAAQAFRAPDPRTTARFVLGALNGVPRWAGPQATAAATDKIGDQLVDHLISGIGVGASPPGSR